MVSLRYWPPNTLLILRPPIFPNTGPPPFGAVLSRPFPTCATRRCATQRYIVAPTDMHTNTQQQLYSLPPGRDCLGRLARDSLSTDGAWRAALGRDRRYA